MISHNSPRQNDFRVRERSGIIEFPVHHMRGGTSTGLVIWERFAPSDIGLREELLRHLMGVPLQGDHAGNRQITGLGRGPATSNKVFFVDLEIEDGTIRLVSTLAQLAADHAAIDWSVNCGNMSAALPLWAFDGGTIRSERGRFEIDIRNTNTGVVTTGRMTLDDRGAFEVAEIPGADGAFPRVDLFLHDPVGAKTGRLLPTGQAYDEIMGHKVSCVDVAVPMVIANAAEFGKTAGEPIADLESDQMFMDSLRHVWVEAGLCMKLKHRDGTLMTKDDISRSETIPKVCIVAPPIGGGSIAVRYFTPQTGHASMAVSGGCCLAAATLVPGSVAHEIARQTAVIGRDFSEAAIAIENPAGVLNATIVARMAPSGLEVQSAAYCRSAQVLLRGHVPLYRASVTLHDALLNPTRLNAFGEETSA